MNCTWRVETAEGRWRRLFLTVVARDRENLIIPPRTKKNSPIPITLKNGRQIILPSSDFKKWERAATRSMLLCFSEMRQHGLMGLTDYVNVEAKIYRQIESWDGSERLKDKDWPRIELCLTYLWPGGTKKAKRKAVSVEPALPVRTGLPLFDELGK